MSLQLCLTPCDLTDCISPDSSVHGIHQARILEWVTMTSSRGSSPAKDRTQAHVSPTLADRFLTTNPTWEALNLRPCCCSVSPSFLTLCDLMDCSTPGFPALHHVPKLAQTYIHWVSGAIQPSHPLSSPSPPALNLFQHQGLFQWVSSWHQVTKVLELHL